MPTEHAVTLLRGAYHKLAVAEARKAIPLPDEQQAEVDAWLDGRYPERKRERAREDYPSFFDDVPRAL